MKHLKKAENEISKTFVYRALIGAIVFIIAHLTELAIAFAAAVMFFIANSIENDVPFAIVMSVEIICGLLIIALIKIKILEKDE